MRTELTEIEQWDFFSVICSNTWSSTRRPRRPQRNPS